MSSGITEDMINFVNFYSSIVKKDNFFLSDCNYVSFVVPYNT